MGDTEISSVGLAITTEEPNRYQALDSLKAPQKDRHRRRLRPSELLVLPAANVLARTLDLQDPVHNLHLVRGLPVRLRMVLPDDLHPALPLQNPRQRHPSHHPKHQATLLRVSAYLGVRVCLQHDLNRVRPVPTLYL